MTRRYFHTELPTKGGVVALNPQESNHAIRVMRLQIGDEIQLFDGNGNEAKAIVTEMSRRECTVTSEPTAVVDREPDMLLELAIALPKPDRARELIERLTELGVAKVVPIVAQRTQRPPSPSLMEKLRRGVVESCKQSGRNVLMEIGDYVGLTDYLSTVGEPDLKVIAHPDGHSLRKLDPQARRTAAALIGPEGGWSDEEVEAATNAGFVKIGLGKRIYRIETAAVTIAANWL